MSNIKGQMLSALAVLVLLSLCGCQTPPGKASSSLCPGWTTVGQAAGAMAQRRAALAPIQATALCVFEYRSPQGSPRQESFDAQIRFVPPEKLYLSGSKFGEIRFGANDTEFWLRVKPELDTYWYGSRDLAQECGQTLMVNPANLAEALGMVDIDADWELFHRDGFDWLTQRSGGRPVKRVYVSACDGHVVRIEYFDRAGQAAAVTELSGYADAGDGLTLPMTIRLATLYRGQEESAVRLELRQVRRFAPTARQMENLFRRPDRDGYGTVLRLDESCNFTEEIR